MPNRFMEPRRSYTRGRATSALRCAVPIPLLLDLPSGRPFDVLGVGQNSVDLVARVHTFPAPNSKQQLAGLVHLPGGQVASALVCCARLGWRTRYVGRFGDDGLGTVGWQSLEREQVDLSAAAVVPGARTRFAVILVDERTGERTVLWDRDPRLAIAPDGLSAAVLQSARVVLVDADDVEASTRAAGLARAAEAVTVVDVEAGGPGVEELLRQIDVMIVSERLPEELTGISAIGRALARLEEWFNPAVVCVTLGPEGCLARRGGVEVHVPACAVACVDSTGAGDAFRGGFISAILAANGRAPLEDVLRYANAVAALSCRRAGARDGLPRREEVDELLSMQP
jgi:sugar/nucleoside kinase (ribokinase family)